MLDTWIIDPADAEQFGYAANEAIDARSRSGFTIWVMGDPVAGNAICAFVVERDGTPKIIAEIDRGDIAGGFRRGVWNETPVKVHPAGSVGEFLARK